MRASISKQHIVEFKNFRIIPGLTSMFYTLFIFLCTYLLFTIILTITAFKYLPITDSWNKIYILVGVILLSTGYSYFLFSVFRNTKPNIQLIIACFSGLLYTSVIGTLILIIIFNDYFIVQNKLLNVGLNEHLQSNVFDSLFQRLDMLWNGEEGQPAFLLLVFTFGLVTLLLPWLVCFRFSISSNFQMFHNYAKIQKDVS